MSEFNRNEIKEELLSLDALIKEYGGVDSYTTTQATTLIKLLCKMIHKFLNRPTLIQSIHQWEIMTWNTH